MEDLNKEKYIEAAKRLSPAYLSGSKWYTEFRSNNIVNYTDIGIVGSMCTIEKYRQSLKD
jgi:hypothetical protein